MDTVPYVPGVSEVGLVQVNAGSARAGLSNLQLMGRVRGPSFGHPAGAS